MIEPYTVVALSPRVSACRTRADYMRNLEHVTNFMDVAHGMAGTDGPPVRLMVLPEGCFQNMLLEFRGGDRKRESEMAVNLPGAETEVLAKKARELNVYIAANAYVVRDEDFPDRYFNKSFIIDPGGELIYTRTKLQVEPFESEAVSTCVPHDVWDRWIEVKGNGNLMDALYPVADTDLGRLGMIICMEGGFPEVGRGLALNGAEVLLRQVYHEPYVNNGWWEVQNRSFAIHNNAYVVATNLGPQSFGPDQPLYDIGGGKSMIVDFKSNILIQREFSAADTFVSECLDIESLRRYRLHNGFGRWFKDMRMEQFVPIYQRTIYPGNQYLENPPTTGWGEREFGILNDNINRIRKEGLLAEPFKPEKDGDVDD